MPSISIIVPAYKVEPYIHRCIDSILNQTYQNFELILVDDGSPDNCGTICDEYANRDNRIHVIHQENAGLSAARNAGLDWVFANSDSQWVAFIDSDDWVHKHYLKILLTNALEQNADISACDLIQTDRYCGDVEIENPAATYLSPEQAYCQCYGYLMPAWRKVYHRDLFHSVRFPVRKIHEDCYVTQIPLFRAKKVAICQAPLYYYFANTDSITRKAWSPARLQEIEAHEVRLAWLEEHHLTKAVQRELQECVDVLFIHGEWLANRCMEDMRYYSYLKPLQKKLKYYLTRARKVGWFPYDRELRWLYILAYAPFGVWRIAKSLQRRKWKYESENG